MGILKRMEDALKQLEGQDQDVHLDLDVPVEESKPKENNQADEAAVSAEPEPAAEAAAPAPEVIAEPVAPARPELNCVPCAGSGLKDEYTLCPNCNGVGFVK